MTCCGRFPTTGRTRPAAGSPTTRAPATKPGDWQQLQWNFVGPFSVNAPEAWANVPPTAPREERAWSLPSSIPASRTPTAAPFGAPPTSVRYEFVQGHDFVAKNSFPNDRNGHGTFVAATIAESTNNLRPHRPRLWRHIMPVRVLNTQGEGEASTIAEGVRFAVNHGARVINLSLEFSPNINASDIPELIEALHYAHKRKVARGRRGGQ